MKLKLDENLGSRRTIELLLDAGHQVSTVFEQGLCSASDHAVIDACRRERRCLVTLDLDFGNPLVFRPSEYEGIVILRLPSKPSHEDLIDAVRTLIGALAQSEIGQKLWIVQRRRVREYQEENAGDLEI
jgi:predicted nuclease of predicted toxin-antitoxin system